jgi:hypothetical protein
MLTFARPRDTRALIPYRIAMQLRRTKRHINSQTNRQAGTQAKAVNPVGQGVATSIEHPAAIDIVSVIESARARGVIGNDAVLRQLESTVGPTFLRATLVSLLAL